MNGCPDHPLSASCFTTSYLWIAFAHTLGLYIFRYQVYVYLHPLILHPHRLPLWLHVCVRICDDHSPINACKAIDHVIFIHFSSSFSMCVYMCIRASLSLSLSPNLIQHLFFSFFAFFLYFTILCFFVQLYLCISSCQYMLFISFYNVGIHLHFSLQLGKIISNPFIFHWH